MDTRLSYNQIQDARLRAEQEIRNADVAVRQAAQLVAGRLRSSGVPGHVLEELKRELKNYNIHTGRWKDG